MEQGLWIFVEFAFAGISTALTYLFVRSFLQRKKEGFNLLGGIVIAAALALKFFASLYFNENVIIISSVSIVAAFIIGRFCFHNKFTWTVMSALFAFLSGAIAELLAGMVIAGFQAVPLGEFMQFGIHRLLGRTLSYLIFLIIVILAGRFRKSSLATMTTKIILALCILPIVSILIVHQVTSHIFETDYIPTVNEVVSMLSIITVNIFIFILVENIMRQNEKSQELLLIKTQSNAQQQYISQLIDNHEQIRQISHDFKQRVDVLYCLCSEKRYDELLGNLSELSNHHGTLLIVKTGNLMLDAILSSKKEDAAKHNIDFEFNLNVQPELPYMSMDICILLGNAIDNAVEACARSCSDKKIIKMDLTADSSRFLLHMKNNIGKTPQTEGEFLKTQKTDSLRHGVGLRSMKQICNKLGGNLTYEYDVEQFKIWIHLPIM